MTENFDKLEPFLEGLWPFINFVYQNRQNLKKSSTKEPFWADYPSFEVLYVMIGATKQI